MSNSKLSVRVLKGLTCTEIYHPGETCTQMLFSNLKTGFPICAAALAPLMLLPPILRKRTRLTKNNAKQMIYKWLSVTTGLHFIAIFAQLNMCILTKVLGRVYVWTFFYLPVSLGSLVTFVIPSGELAAAEMANNLSAMGIEAAFRHFSGIFSYATIRTMVFMCVSAIVIDATRLNKLRNTWWILQPASTRHAPPHGSPSITSPVLDQFAKNECHTCSHKGSCDLFVYDGIKTYFAIYLALDAGRILIAHGTAIRNAPASILKVFLNNWNGKLLTFSLGYATMYRFFSCLLNRRNKRETRKTTALSSFLSASAYYFYPNYTLLAQGSVIALRILWNHLSEICPVIQEINEKLPLAQIILFFTSGMLYHMRAFHPYICPAAGIKATDYISSSRTGRALQHFTKRYLGYL